MSENNYKVLGKLITGPVWFQILMILVMLLLNILFLSCAVVAIYYALKYAGAF